MSVPRRGATHRDSPVDAPTRNVQRVRIDLRPTRVARSVVSRSRRLERYSSAAVARDAKYRLRNGKDRKSVRGHRVRSANQEPAHAHTPDAVTGRGVSAPDPRPAARAAVRPTIKRTEVTPRFPLSHRAPLTALRRPPSTRLARRAHHAARKSASESSSTSSSAWCGRMV